MKRTVSIIITLCILLSIIYIEGNGKKQVLPDESPPPPNTNQYVKAIWLSQFDMHGVYTKDDKQRNIDEYSALIDNIVSNIAELGFNTVFIQLRPNGDSIYPSELFPPSKYVCGSYSNNFIYDPFAIFLAKAKEKGLSIHSWINPLRCMSEEEIKQVSGNYLISEWCAKRKYVATVNGKYYLDPAHREVREYICLGVAEILQKYSIDGIHIDDYFYPTTSKDFDAQSYLQYKSEGGSLSLEDFRRNNINLLISEIYKTVKNERIDAWFGVSPSGNNKRNYNELYADVALWCGSDGYIDYICPQIYFGFEHSTHSFDKICNEFSSLVTSDSVKLFIGITLEKAALGTDGKEDFYAGTGKSEWIEQKDIVARSLSYCQTLTSCSGVAIFSYQHFYDPVTNTENEKTKEERRNLIPVLKGLSHSDEEGVVWFSSGKNFVLDTERSGVCTLGYVREPKRD